MSKRVADAWFDNLSAARRVEVYERSADPAANPNPHLWWTRLPPDDKAAVLKWEMDLAALQELGNEEPA